MTPQVTQGSLFFDSLDSKSDAEIISHFTAQLGTSSLAHSEHEFLDYKNGKIDITKTEGKDKVREEWSQSLSGFSNSGGGVIVWGIQTAPVDKHDVPKNFALVDNPNAFLGLLKGYLASEVDPPVTNAKFRVAIKDANEGLVICYIPPSDSKPHRSNFTKQYYIRSSHQHVDIGPSLLRILFYPQFDPRLELGIDVDLKKGSPAHGFPVRLKLRNTGSVTIPSIYVALHTPTGPLRFAPSRVVSPDASDESTARLWHSNPLHPLIELILGTATLQMGGSTLIVNAYGHDMKPYAWVLDGTNNPGEFRISKTVRLD